MSLLNIAITLIAAWAAWFFFKTAKQKTGSKRAIDLIMCVFSLVVALMNLGILLNI